MLPWPQNHPRVRHRGYWFINPGLASLAAMEAHLIIIWERGLAHPNLAQALAQITLPVAERHRVTWAGQRFLDNLRRFYNRASETLQLKCSETGTGAFLALVLQDRQPEYGLRNTSVGIRRVNTRMHDLREALRATLGGNVVHGTITAEEGRRDLYLMFGRRADEFLALPPQPAEAPPQLRDADLVGGNGWSRIEDIFALLNEALPYMVLRNFEALPEQVYVPGHNDVDLLVQDFKHAARLINGSKVFPEPWRVHYRVDIAGHDIRFDLRSVGDNYFDTRWQADVLGRRYLSERGFYRPEAVDYFYTLLYHALVHKRQMKPDYATRLSRMADDLVGLKLEEAMFFDRNRAFDLLSRHMKGLRYQATIPHDHSVFCVFRQPPPQPAPQA